LFHCRIAKENSMGLAGVNISRPVFSDAALLWTAAETQPDSQPHDPAEPTDPVDPIRVDPADPTKPIGPTEQSDVSSAGS
jgi:hypothetical protein